MGATEVSRGTGENAEAIEAWDGPLFERFVRFREIVTAGLGAHGEEALRLFPPGAGSRVLDIGCGFGDTTQRVAELAGPDGSAVGVDAAPRFIEAARQEAAEAGLGRVSFAVADVQSDALGGPYDMAFSRFGTMFFANPVVALRNVREALRPGARLVMVVWRRRIDNDWLYRGQTIVESIVTRPEEYDEPTCGPGPFSMADADTTSEVLVHAGYSAIELHRSRSADRDRDRHRPGDRDHHVAGPRWRDPAPRRRSRRPPPRQGARRPPAKASRSFRRRTASVRPHRRGSCQRWREGGGAASEDDRKAWICPAF